MVTVRCDVSPGLPDYIMENEMVRVALHIAKEKAGANDLQRFIEVLEQR